MLSKTLHCTPASSNKLVMALFKQIQETYRDYAGRNVVQNSSTSIRLLIISPPIRLLTISSSIRLLTISPSTAWRTHLPGILLHSCSPSLLHENTFLSLEMSVL